MPLYDVDKPGHYWLMPYRNGLPIERVRRVNTDDGWADMHVPVGSPHRVTGIFEVRDPDTGEVNPDPAKVAAAWEAKRAAILANAQQPPDAPADRLVTPLPNTPAEVPHWTTTMRDRLVEQAAQSLDRQVLAEAKANDEAARARKRHTLYSLARAFHLSPLEIETWTPEMRADAMAWLAEEQETETKALTVGRSKLHRRETPNTPMPTGITVASHTTPCPACGGDGQGEIWGPICGACGGTGRKQV